MGQEPTFKTVFGEVWERFPPIIRARYANRPYSQDLIKAEGRMDITYSPLIRFLLPVLHVLVQISKGRSGGSVNSW